MTANTNTPDVRFPLPHTGVYRDLGEVQMNVKSQGFYWTPPGGLRGTNVSDQMTPAMKRSFGECWNEARHNEMVSNQAAANRGETREPLGPRTTWGNVVDQATDWSGGSIFRAPAEAAANAANIGANTLLENPATVKLMFTGLALVGLVVLIKD
jgi:hypothetical protein